MRILLDMNLSPQWVAFLQEWGFEATHWSAVGNPKAADAEVMAWGRRHGHIVMTHDLDLGAILAATQAEGPSVIQLRMQDVLPGSAGGRLVEVLSALQGRLEQGLLLTIDESKSRVRTLPLRP